MSYFSVEGGALTGTTTSAHNPHRNQFLVHQGAPVADFELTFEFRMEGVAANSGMQFRSEVKEHGLVFGYQADIALDASYLGGIWDEYGPRTSLAKRGEASLISEEGVKTTAPLPGFSPDALPRDPEALAAWLATWNRYRIVARGARMDLYINDQPTASLVDDERERRRRSGVLAVPVIPGAPMRVQYRKLLLRRF